MAVSNRVRIGGGQWRSRLLSFPDTPGLRPTPDRVRQTLFNWLGQQLDGLHCLDLFSGTGVLGFEALSRGAKSAVMVEKSAIAYKALQLNKTLLNANAAHLVQMDAMHYLAQETLASAQPFDIVFLDPPYNQGWLAKALPLVRPILAGNGQVYAEAEFQLIPDEHWQIVKHGKAGSVFYHLLRAA